MYCIAQKGKISNDIGAYRLKPRSYVLSWSSQ